jgi:hypothetical protein
MKNIVTIILFLFISGTLMAQGNSGNKGKSNNTSTTTDDNTDQGKDKDKNKNKDKDKDKNKDKKNDDNTWNDHDKKVWEGIGDNNCMKPSRNQPAKVSAAFQRDYPGAVNVRWTKCRGDWTATFNGSLFRSTAVYHANGQRRDTRTPVSRDNIPRRILDIILKRDPRRNIDGAVRIDVPNTANEIFRIRDINNQFEYYNTDGMKVNYNY